MPSAIEKENIFDNAHRRRIYTFIARNEGAQISQIANECKLSESCVINHLYRLEDYNMIIRNGGLKLARYYTKEVGSAKLEQDAEDRNFFLHNFLLNAGPEGRTFSELAEFLGTSYKPYVSRLTKEAGGIRVTGYKEGKMKTYYTLYPPFQENKTSDADIEKLKPFLEEAGTTGRTQKEIRDFLESNGISRRKTHFTALKSGAIYRVLGGNKYYFAPSVSEATIEEALSKKRQRHLEELDEVLKSVGKNGIHVGDIRNFLDLGSAPESSVYVHQLLNELGAVERKHSSNEYKLLQTKKEQLAEEMERKWQLLRDRLSQAGPEGLSCRELADLLDYKSRQYRNAQASIVAKRAGATKLNDNHVGFDPDRTRYSMKPEKRAKNY